MLNSDQRLTVNKVSRVFSDSNIQELIQSLNELLATKQAGIDKEFLDSSDVCLYLGISKSHLYKISHKKLLPKYKFGKKIYFKKEDIDQLLNKNRLMSAAEIAEKVKTYTH